MPHETPHTRRFKLDPMPTTEQVRSYGLGPGIAAASVALIQHGINPLHIAHADDALEPEGYLRVTGRILADNEIETERIAWPTTADWDAVAPHREAAIRNMRNEL